MAHGIYFGSNKGSEDMGFIKRLTWPSFFTLFQNRENAEIAKGLRELMNTAVLCSVKLDKKLELKWEDMLELEHRGDDAVDHIEEALEYAFIVRFGKGDPTRLVHQLDDCIDGMRDVARHIEAYAPFLDPFPASSSQLIALVKEGVGYLDNMVAEITNGRQNRKRVNEWAHEIEEIERKADKIRADAEIELVNMRQGSDARFFFGHTRLNKMLEDITDHIKNCSVGVLAIARQET